MNCSVPAGEAWSPFFNQVRRARFMELTFLCPNCGVVNHVPSLAAAGRGTCSQCRTGRLAPLRTGRGRAIAGLSLVRDLRPVHSERLSPGAGAVHRDRWLRDQHGLLVSREAALHLPGAAGFSTPRYGSLLPGSRRHDLLPLPEPDSRCGLQSRGSLSSRSTWPSASVIARNGSGLKSCASGAARWSRHRRPCPALLRNTSYPGSRPPVINPRNASSAALPLRSIPYRG